MKIFRIIFVFLLIFIFVLFAGKTVVLGAYEYTAAEIEANKNKTTGEQIFAPNSGCLGCAGTDATSYTGGIQDYSGFYEWPPDSGSYYAIGLPQEPQYNGGGGGGGPEDNSSGHRLCHSSMDKPAARSGRVVSKTPRRAVDSTLAG